MSLPETAPSLADIRSARDATAGLALRTPLITAPSLSALAGREVLLKLESLQPIGAFKLRGAINAVSRLDHEQKRRGIGCCSTGNHGRAVAYAAARAGIRATICLSALVPDAKVRAIQLLGAEVKRIGNSQDAAQAEIDRLVRSDGLTDIPPFDHPHVIAGQGTIALELLDDRPDLSAIIVPLSGGGLISGIAIAAKALKPDIRIIGVSMDRGAAMHESLMAGRPVDVTEVPSLADSLGGGIGLANRWTFPICRALVDETILVGEEEIYRGMQALFGDQKLVTEGAAAVGPAALIAGKLKLNGPAAMIISGHNVDPDQFLAIAGGQPVKIGDQVIRG
ncbi:hydroxyectoine utilization dehydratase EutB [Dongia deserti]|uniref:hydroxyectoine utilization dehydratase EutB n=1 Tax=Dongia deserti TaxID=2268030 RepID=UPI000E647644|nr:hydroxyectoine utilization dehydratase EutB [Dongia deserti]